ncbi:MAG: hypothetical protein A4E73_00439 [Syntrophaceae bacterium PtaU1.Bin231]|nr:MAG: hypothetical protein A4E73_00439 [Syntrophaceae bacterium PtaU1.Bin231]
MPSRNIPTTIRKSIRRIMTPSSPPPKETTALAIGSTIPMVLEAQAKTLARPTTMRMTAEVSADSTSSSPRSFKLRLR